MKQLKTDLCIIGAGSGGLSVAAAASQMGAKVVLIEQNKMGGDCLNYGCIPSKSLLAAAKQAQHIQASSPFGITANIDHIDYQAIQRYIQRRIERIAPHDSIERFTNLGVEVIIGTGYFVSPKQVQVADYIIRARRFIIATGSKPLIPTLIQKSNIDYLSNETIFNLQQKPEHLVILGAGPIGCEIAYAYSAFGTKVTLIARSYLLSKEDSELVKPLRDHLAQYPDFTLLEHSQITEIEQNAPEQINLILSTLIAGDPVQQRLQASHLLVATGRTANFKNLKLEQAEINYDKKGIIVNPGLQTSNRKVYAIGDVIAGPQFTHAANYHAGIIIKKLLFHLPSKNTALIPRVTYCSPEIAQVGLTEQEAKSRYPKHKITVLTQSFSNNDRAICENRPEGLIKVIALKNGRILGAGIAHHRAGDLIAAWQLALQQKLSLKHMASLLLPYPNYSEASKACAASFYTPKLYSAFSRTIIKQLVKLNLF